MKGPYTGTEHRFLSHITCASEATVEDYNRKYLTATRDSKILDLVRRIEAAAGVAALGAPPSVWSWLSEKSRTGEVYGYTLLSRKQLAWANDLPDLVNHNFLLADPAWVGVKPILLLRAMNAMVAKSAPRQRLILLEGPHSMTSGLAHLVSTSFSLVHDQISLATPSTAELGTAVLDALNQRVRYPQPTAAQTVSIQEPVSLQKKSVPSFSTSSSKPQRKGPNYKDRVAAEEKEEPKPTNDKRFEGRTARKL